MPAHIKTLFLSVIFSLCLPDFRAKAAFPDLHPDMNVNDWVNANSGNYDFNKYGWPAWYPTRSLAQWEEARKQWEPYVFRKPDEDIPRPSIVHSKKKPKKKKQP